MGAVVPRSGFEERLALLRLERARLDGQIAEVEFWVDLCAKAEATPGLPAAEAPARGRKATAK